MSDNKNFSKCPKCRVTNLAESTQCRNCKASLPTASATSPSLSTQMHHPTHDMGASSKSVSGAVSATSVTSAISASPPQIYQGPPPSRSGYDDAPTRSNLTPWYAGGAVIALLTLFFLVLVMAPAPVQAIEILEAHTSKDNVFTCQSPKGWEVQTGARSDGLSGSSLWTSGSAKILISDDLGGSLMSEGAPPAGKTKVQVLHEKSLRSMTEKYGNYEEEPALRIADNGFGETWKSEFSAQGGFRVGDIRGMRATMLSVDKRVKFITTCRVQDWDKLKPGFEKVLMSLGRPTDPSVIATSSASTP